MNADAAPFVPDERTAANVRVAERVGQQAAALAASQNHLALSDAHLNAVSSTIDLLQQLVPFFRPQLSGSFAIGLWTSSSDIDFVLTVREPERVPVEFHSLPLSKILAGESAVQEARRSQEEAMRAQPGEVSRHAKKEARRAIEHEVLRKAMSERLARFGFEIVHFCRFLTRLRHIASGTKVDLWYDCYLLAVGINEKTPKKKSSNEKPPNKDKKGQASLFVGDLAPAVVERDLYNTFEAIGPVASTRVCRDYKSRQSLGYGYVNYRDVTSADAAVAALSGTLIAGFPCRVAHSQRAKSMRLGSSMMPRRIEAARDWVNGNVTLRAMHSVCHFCLSQLGCSSPEVGSEVSGYDTKLSGYVLLAIIIQVAFSDPDSAEPNGRSIPPSFQFSLGRRLLNLLDTLGTMPVQNLAITPCGLECRIADLVKGYPALRVDRNLLENASASFRLLADRLRQGIGLYRALQLADPVPFAADGTEDPLLELQNMHLGEFEHLRQVYSSTILLQV